MLYMEPFCIEAASILGMQPITSMVECNKDFEKLLTCFILYRKRTISISDIITSTHRFDMFQSMER